MESSFDLLANRLLKMTQRKPGMIPTPFVLNDALIIKQKLKPSPKVIEEKTTFKRYQTKSDSLKVAIVSLKR